MTPKRVLITGASGFIGCACVHEFIERGWFVTALINKSYPPALDNFSTSPAFDTLKVSVCDDEHLQSAISKYSENKKIDCILHCAGRPADIGPDGLFRKLNFESVRNIVKLLSNLSIGKLIFISTTDVYGIKDFQDADEKTEFSNNLANPYPHYKILSEKYISEHLPPSKYVIIRPAAVWGPGDNTILPRVLSFLKTSPFIVNFGKWKGRNRWPLAFIGNLSKAVYFSAATDTLNGQALNIIDKEKTNIEEYYRILIDAFIPDRKNVRTINLPFPVGWALASSSTCISNLLRMEKPLFEPSLYGLYSVSKNLDFSHKKLEAFLNANGEKLISREEALAELKKLTSSMK